MTGHYASNGKFNFLRYDVINICLAKNGLCLSQNRPAAKLFQALQMATTNISLPQKNLNGHLIHISHIIMANIDVQSI